MPPSNKTIKPITGTLLINSKRMFNMTACEITPGGNGFYAITVRQVLNNQPPEMFKETYKGVLHFVYQHSALQDIRLQGQFLDFGIQDENGEVVLSLFFRAQQEESPIAIPTKPSITLAK